MAAKKPTVNIPPMVRPSGPQVPPRTTINGGVTGQKMQPIPTGKGGQGGGGNSGGGKSN